MSIPSEARAGDTLKFKESLTNYPATSWTLTYTLINATNKYTFVATSIDTDYSVSISHLDTAAWAAGLYKYVAVVSNSSEQYTVSSGVINILPNLSTAQAIEPRTHAEIVLDNINAVLEDKATLEQASYSIEGRSLNARSIDDLLKLKTIYESKVKAEQAKRAGYRKNYILVSL